MDRKLPQFVRKGNEKVLRKQHLNTVYYCHKCNKNYVYRNDIPEKCIVEHELFTLDITP